MIAQIEKITRSGQPVDIESEMALLGAILVSDGDAIGDVAEIIKPFDFYKPAHVTLYSALLDLHDAGQKADIVKLNAWLRDRQKLEEVGGVQYVSDLINSVPSHTEATNYAKRVREKALLRSHVNTLVECVELAYKGDGAPASELIDDAVGRMMGLLGTGRATKIEPLADMVQEVVAEIAARSEMDNPPPLGLPTGLVDLDHLLVGLENGTQTILGARTSTGKTALGMQIAEHMSIKAGPVGVFCLEMTKKQLVYRLLSSKSGVSSWSLRTGKIQSDEWPRIHRAEQDSYAVPISVCICPGLTLTSLRTISKRMVQRGVRAIFIDHLGLMRMPRAENRNLALGEITAGIKSLAIELDIPAVVLCQLSRAAEDADRPSLRHLRESGHIEEDADNVILIHRPEFKERRKAGAHIDGPEPVEFIVEKNRQGPVGTVEAWFDGATMTFKSRDWAHERGVA